MAGIRRNLFLDFDGTLIDSRRRMHGLFQSLIPETQLDFETYWALKRSKKSHADILTQNLGYTTAQLEAFEDLWMPCIELQEWLDLDVPFTGATEFLAFFSEKADLYLVTCRQLEDMVAYQLDKFRWQQSFKEVLVTGGKRSKYDMLRGFPGLKPTDWIIGDTPHDIQTGKKLGIKTAAVLTGFVNSEFLLAQKPDLLLKSIAELREDDMLP